MECRLMSKLVSLREQIAKLQKKAKAAAKELFHEGSVKLFEDNPDLVKITWRQYTPYFNDGDTCVFSANHTYADVFTKATSEDEDECLENVGDFPKVEEFLEQFTDDDMFALFGDHVKVIVTSEGIEVEDYDHD